MEMWANKLPDDRRGLAIATCKTVQEALDPATSVTGPEHNKSTGLSAEKPPEIEHSQDTASRQRTSGHADGPSGLQ